MLTEDEVLGCFGAVDRIFAAHPLDEQRAFDLLSKIRDKGITAAQVGKIFRDTLRNNGCDTKHISNQMKSVKRHFDPWLS